MTDPAREQAIRLLADVGLTEGICPDEDVDRVMAALAAARADGAAEARREIAAYVRSCRENRNVVQVFDVLADQIEKGAALRPTGTGGGGREAGAALHPLGGAGAGGAVPQS